jgi:N-terminal domain of NWD NACHT-NTPase
MAQGIIASVKVFLVKFKPRWRKRRGNGSSNFPSTTSRDDLADQPRLKNKPKTATDYSNPSQSKPFDDSLSIHPKIPTAPSPVDQLVPATNSPNPPAASAVDQVSNSADRSTVAIEPSHLPVPKQVDQPALLHSEKPADNSNQTLWDNAYEKIEISDPKLFKDYERLMRDTERVIREKSANASSQSNSNNEPKTSKDLLERIIDDGLRQQKANEIKVSVFGKEVSISSATSTFANFVLDFKEFVGAAVQASPPASLAWVGVCLMLPLLTVPETAKRANADGFTEITYRMGYYVNLEKLLSHENEVNKEENPVFVNLNNDLGRLYQHILLFQMKSAVRYHECRSKRLWDDFFKREDWAGAIAEIEKSESLMRDHQSTLSGLKICETLQNISTEATKSYKVQIETLNNLKGLKEIVMELLQTVKPSIDLPTVERAQYNRRSNESDTEPIASCMKGTRLVLLNLVEMWAKDPMGETILWVYGPAGIGKSTIAWSVAEGMTNKHQLAASYFFRRRDNGNPNRNDATLFFPTLVRQLVNTIPTFITSLENSLGTAGGKSLGMDTIAELPLKEQFEKLIRIPLTKIEQDASKHAATVIVIDALDECESLDDIVLICQLLSQLKEIKIIQLRVFITSREEIKIRSQFDAKDVRSIDVLEDFGEETKNNISLFLTNRFKDIKESESIQELWPDPIIMEELINRATNPSPLFIYAYTLCRFVDDGAPRIRLQEWMNSKTRTSELGRTYDPVVQQVLNYQNIHDRTFKNQKKLYGRDMRLGKNEVNQLIQILATITLSATPISVPVIASLLGIKDDEVWHWLRKLHAVLRLPKQSDTTTPVNIVHESFRSYLLEEESDEQSDEGLDEKEDEKLNETTARKLVKRIDPKERHKKLFSDCFRLIRTSKDTQWNKISGLQYACTYWVHHLQRSKVDYEVDNDVCAFLNDNGPRWISILNQDGQLSKALSMIEVIFSIRSGSSFGFPPLQKNVVFLSLCYLKCFPIIHRYFFDNSQNMSNWMDSETIIKRINSTRNFILILFATMNVDMSAPMTALDQLMSIGSDKQDIKSIVPIFWEIAVLVKTILPRLDIKPPSVSYSLKSSVHSVDV